MVRMLDHASGYTMIDVENALLFIRRRQINLSWWLLYSRGIASTIPCIIAKFMEMTVVYEGM